MAKQQKALQTQTGKNKLADHAHEIDKCINRLVVSATESFYELGLLMKQMRDEELYLHLGYDSFAQYYGRPEYSFKKSSVNHAISMVEKFPEPKKIIDVPVSKLIVVKPHITDKNRDEMIGMAKALSYSDLVHQLVIKKMATEFPDLPAIPKIYPCNVCGGVKGVSFDRLCHCGWTPKQITFIGKLIDNIMLGGDIHDKE